MRVGLAIALVCAPSLLGCDPEVAALGNAPLFGGCEVPPITTGEAPSCGAGLGAVVSIYPSPLEDRVASCRARFEGASADTTSTLCPRGLMTPMLIGDALVVVEGQTNDSMQGVFVHELDLQEGSAAVYARTRFLRSAVGAELLTAADPHVLARPNLLADAGSAARFVDTRGVIAFDGSTFVRTHAFALPLFTRITAYDAVRDANGAASPSIVLATGGVWAGVQRFDEDGTLRFAWRFETEDANLFEVQALGTNEDEDIAFVGRFGSSTWLVVLDREGRERMRRRIPTVHNVALRYGEHEVLVLGTTRISRRGTSDDLDEGEGPFRDFAMRFGEGGGCPTQLHEIAMRDVSLTEGRRAFVALRDGSFAHGFHPGAHDAHASLVTSDGDGLVCDAAELASDATGFAPLTRIVELADQTIVATDGAHVWHVLRE